MNRKARIEIPEVLPPQGLYERILGRVQHLSLRAARIRATVLGAVSILCGIAIIPAIGYVIHDLSASGFLSYFSLLFSDWSTIGSSWKELALSLTDALPSLSLLTLALVVAALWLSARRSVKDARFVFRTQARAY